MNFSLLNLKRSVSGRARFLLQRHTDTIRFVMKVSAVYIYAMILSLQIFARPGNGQNLNNIFVNLSAENESLSNVFSKIETQTGIAFSYFPEQVRIYKVSLPKANRSVRATLDLALAKTELTYKQWNNNIVIKMRLEDNSGVSSVNNAQPSEINQLPIVFNATGKVTEETTDEPLAGVNVLIKGTTTGTTTDIAGEFSIDVKNNDVLIFSFIGYKAQEMQVSEGRNVYNVTLEEDIASLKEVVINAGYYKVTDRTKTGNISKISSEMIGKQPISNPLAAIQGRVPGLYISQQTGVPGGAFNVLIRGKNSLASGNNPMFIIDGVPFPSSQLSSEDVSFGATRQGSPLTNINPNDIESIEVLKDADATAIYGSRGANGIILITTKKGVQGKTKFDIDVYSGVSTVTNMMDLLNTQQYLEMRKEAFKNDGAEPQPWDYDLTEYDSTRSTNWQKELYGRTANTTNAQLSISGGNANTSFLVSGSFRKETTVFPGDFGDKKGSGHFNLNHLSDDKRFGINITTSYVVDNNNLLASDPVPTALTLAPNSPEIYNDDGSLNWANSTWLNPFAAFSAKYQSNSSNLMVNGVLSYELFPGLEFKSNLGFTNVQIKEQKILPTTSFNPAWGLSSGQSYFADNGIKTWIIEPQIEYKRAILNGELSLLAGTTFQQNISDKHTYYATGFPSDALVQNIRAASSVFVVNSDYTKYRYNAFFSRINYNYRGKYLLNLTGRRDGSSRFGPGKQFANFGSFGLGWIFSEEGLLRDNVNILSFGKLRASYGITGNDQIPDYGYLDSWNTTSYPYQGIKGLSPARLFNANYSWEKTKKFEIALEVGFINDRISLTTSYYQNQSSNQLVGYSLPSITGFFSVQNNFPATLRNTGVELELNTINVRTGDFTWSTFANLTIPRSKLVEFPDLEASPYSSTYAIDKSLSIRYAIHSTGVDPQTGIYQFEDFDKDGSISYPNDYQTLHELTQSFYGGIQNIFQFKNFELDVFFQFVKQTGENYYQSVFDAPGMFGNQPTIVMNRWQNPGDQTNIQRFTQSFSTVYSAYTMNKGFSDYSFSDASFIRLKNVSLSYQLPIRITQRLHLKRSKVYVQGQNLWTMTNYLGIDPETQSTALPPLRTLAFGIQITL